MRGEESPSSTTGLVYRGSKKHKLWRPDGGFGTICPAWTHTDGRRAIVDEDDATAWSRTTAQTMLSASVVDKRGRRYAASRGIAFSAQMSNDGTWHGYPVPWLDVPPVVRDALVDAGHVVRRDIRRQVRLAPNDRFWALSDDD
ncbi:hypothetical protein [Salinarimonas ramus]|uniref:Uncharacterized protein n=1 Tax=Salinarimonas ramus TaxID=690164 RepID=A0A917V1Y6_9HYPH|nr:hypothetical protein [Salinarimonas ramus]GGK17382.1 hypothetical protein GCM10011322_00040 [Salinarimonas ramus]